MSLLNIFFIAIALSFDVMAVCAAGGARESRLSFLTALRAAVFFAFFQALMPLIGWLVGLRLEKLIADFDHWVAFLLLAILGLKMIWESLKADKKKRVVNMDSPKILFLLSLATGIDAWVAGVTFAFLPVSIWAAVSIIGLTTFVLALLAIFIGKKSGERWGQKAEIAGGLILIALGLKILLSHLLV